MAPFDQPSVQRAQLYCSQHRTQIVDQPGQDGNDGSVHVTDRFTVVKAFDRRETYARETEAYHRLARREVVQIHGHHVPQLRNEDEKLGVLELSIVRPPFLLDFGKVRFDQRLEDDWPAEVLEERWAYWESLFEAEQWSTVLAIFNELGRQYGIWLEDIHPGNIRFAEGG